MKKFSIVLVMVAVLLLCPSMVHAIDPLPSHTTYVACGDAKSIPQPVPQLTSVAYTLIIIAVPVILIVFSIVTLVKAVTAGSPDEILKARGKLIKKFIAAAIIFFVAGITQFVVTKAADDSEGNNIASCISCFLYYDGCTESEPPEAYR